MNANAPETFPEDAWELLSPLLSPERQEKLKRVAAQRTRHIRLVVQDIHHPHNISACLRSAEAFGVLNIDIVNLKEKFEPSTVARGVHHWLRIRKFASVADCAEDLKNSGYRVAAAFPSQTSVPLADLPLDKPLAVVFGNEHEGVHDSWRPHIDIAFTIPMVGHVESLNISVSTAICLHELCQRTRREQPDAFRLSEAEQRQLLAQWVCGQFRSWPQQIAKLRSQKTHPPRPDNA